MWSLFDTRGDRPAGYRLKMLEVFNWGTFHEGANRNGIWRITLDGQNTLLTGANGSGKTTLVDGLLALLVNPQKRFFNQSSGAKSSRDRTEESYVEGHYGRTQNDEQQNAKVEKLRPHRADTYSIILGVFANEGAGSVPITLVQVRWFSNSGLQRRYLIAKHALNIAEHIQFSTDGQWLRKLKRQFNDRLSDYESFPKYAEQFQLLFGMRSEKALSLFNQTVGMKVLGDLDEFIRTNMLEEHDGEEAFKKLYGNYQTLLTAYQSLEKARTQLTLLEPVFQLSHAHDGLNQRIRQTQEHQRLLPAWFDREQVRIWADEHARQNRELTRLEDKLTQQERDWQTADDRRIDLSTQIANNQTAQQIKDLERELKGLEKTKNEKEQNRRDYNKLARPLGLTEDPDEAAFRANLDTAQALQATLTTEKKRLDEQRYESRKRRDEQQKTFDALTAEIDQLLNSVGKVTGRPAEIRRELLETVDATEAEIPFLAEVIQVRPDERAKWNDGIEKILHNPGLGLLVPDEHYSAVNRYVNEHPDLRGKVVFHRVERKAARPLFPDPRALVTKLEFNGKSPYAAWVEQHIGSRYNYICVETQAEFERMTEKALLPSGLQRNKDRHERDDSPNRRHILGWDNRELLRDKQRTARDLSEQLTKLDRSLTQLDKEQTKNDDAQIRVTNLLTLNQFSKLDVQADVLAINELAKQKATLESSNQTLKTMQEQLAELKKTITALETDRQRTRDDFRDTERLLVQLAMEQSAAQHRLDSFDSDDLPAELTQLAERTRPLRDQLSYAHFAKQKDSLTQAVLTELGTLVGERNSLERQIRATMTAYRSPGKAILDQFTDWNSDLDNLGIEIDQLPEYVDRYEQIRDQNIVELEGRFRDEFKNGATKALTDYCNALDLQHESIVDTIDHINASLRQIPFNLNPNTYIQLERTDARRPVIRTFRFEKMRSWQPDKSLLALADDPKEAEMRHFVERVQPFIRELQQNEKWRQEVTDVRNWSEFKAREYYMADNAPRPGGTYDSSGSLSGGEAAQLAYTVLGAAIAYQFGIHRDGSSHRSFRFIVVDEAFSKLDEEKSTYLLNLCRGLGLQLMVVTPLTSIHLLENDVSVIHWVTKSQQDRRQSTVRDIPILEYQAIVETQNLASLTPDGF